MGSLTLAAIVFAVVFVGGAIGLELQRALPESHTTGGPKDMTGAVVGLMTLLLALVLGLLIWTAYGVFSTQKTSVQTLAITDLKLDGALQDYGPEAAEGHRILREGIKNTIAEIWKNSDDELAVFHKFGYARANLKARLALLNTLQPASDQQTAAKTEATQAAIAIDQTLAQMTLALVDPISYSLISIVVAWAAFLFCGYGLLSKRHPMSYVVLVVGAMGIASAIYIIVDLISPFSGVFVVSPAIAGHCPGRGPSQRLTDYRGGLRLAHGRSRTAASVRMRHWGRPGEGRATEARPQAASSR